MKFSNGVMVCWGNETYTIASWPAWTNVYQGVDSNGKGVDVTFAEPFISIPSVSVITSLPSPSATSSTANQGISTTGINQITAIRPNGGGYTGITCTASYIAIGRWK